jgi:hypothetical protein
VAKKPETKFRHNQVLPFLRTLKNTWYEPIQQVAVIGSPDFILCIYGLFVALELKSDVGKVSPLQRHKLKMVEKAQGIAIVACPRNWEQVKQRLTNLDGGINGNASN